MVETEGLSFREQLEQVRGRVLVMEERRTTEKHLQRQRNEQALRVQLKQDTPEALNQQFNEIRRLSDRAARRFYPLKHLEEVLKDIGEFGSLLRFYADCMKQFGKVFTANHKTAIPKLLGELGNLQHGLDRQLGQWRLLQSVIENTTFRARQASDDAALVSTAKAFSERAHNVPLSIPGDYFAHEGEHFSVAECEGAVLGYVKYWPEDKVITLALSPATKVNFSKFVRGLLHKFHTAGILPEEPKAVRIRIGYVREVKFFTDMGFVRAETKGPSDWIYRRELN